MEENTSPITEEVKVEKVEAPIEQPEEEKPQTKNFRNLREEKERIERERDSMREQLTRIESQFKGLENSEEEVDLRPDDLVEWKHVDKKIKNLENQMREYQQKTAISSVETQIKQKYPDFETVVSDKNIEGLRLAYPELAQALNNSTDLYSKAISAYTLIKKFGIGENTSSFDVEKQRVQENHAKPRSTASISPNQSNTPLQNADAFANGLTNELKAQLYKEMIDARKTI